MLAGCDPDPEPHQPAPDSLRQTAEGAVVGFADRGDTWTWLGIPFARPPLGDLRWRAPRPPEPREGTLEALAFGPMCPQLPIPMVDKTGEPWLGDEDCLYLNVSAPRSWTPGDAPLPVMLWMHGGGNTVGSADLYTALRNLAAREQVVTVSIHYRLGVLGWFSHPALRAQADNPLDASGNFGTLDTIAALQWVQGNINAFGGDPGNVTVFGESAGGINTFALLLSPLAEGLFHRAISQSGMLLTVDPSNAENAVDAEPPGHENSSVELLLRLLQEDGLASDRAQAAAVLDQWDDAVILEYLRSKPPQDLLAQMRQSEQGLYPIPTLLRDGMVIPSEDPLLLLQRGRFNRVPVILGTNRDEMKTMMVSNPHYTKLRFGVLPTVPDQELYDRVTAYGSRMWQAIGADEPARAIAASGHEEIFVYRFDWDEAPSNWFMDLQSLLGAGHSFEIPFVFHDIDGEMTYMPLQLIDGENRAYAEPLARSMSSYWGAFAHGGDPGQGSTGDQPRWKRWQDPGRYLVFDTPQGGGVRMREGSLDRSEVFSTLAAAGAELGGQDGVCRAYTELFGEEAIFSFTTACNPEAPCPAEPLRFCREDVPD
jgi:para-nitrobenzyl esterase